MHENTEVEERQADALAWRALVELSPSAVAVLDADGTIVYANPATAALLGEARVADLHGRSAAEFTPEEDRESARSAFAVALDGGTVPGWGRRVRRSDGRPVDVELDGTSVQWCGRPAVRIEVRDVTVRAAAESALVESERRWRRLFDHSPVGISLTDERGHVIAANAALCALLGRSEADVLGTRPLGWDEPDGAPDAEPSPEPGTAPGRLESRYVRADGEPRWALLTVTDTPGPAGERWTVTHVQDVTGRRRGRRLAALVAELETLALSDQLTQLPNRRAWDRQLPPALLAARHSGRPFTVAVADIDHFKAYNDRHGHPAGDVLLRRVAAAARASLREGDIVARWGGEEFAIALPACRGTEAAGVLDRVRRAMPEGLTCSIGWATWDGVEDATGLMVRADAALYAAKRSGRNRVAAAA